MINNSIKSEASLRFVKKNGQLQILSSEVLGGSKPPSIFESNSYHQNSTIYSSFSNDDIDAFIVGYVDGLNCSSEKSLEYLIELHGQDRLNGNVLDGFFCLCLHDKKKNVIKFVTDSSAMRRWYFYASSDFISISNKISRCIDWLPENDQPELNHNPFFFVYGFYPLGQTVYKSVESTNAQTYLEVRLDNDFESSLEVMKSLGDKVSRKSKQKRIVDVVGQLEDCLLESVKSNAPKSKKIGVLLGGFDSALVASLLHRTGHAVETFSFRYKQEKFNQKHTDSLSDFLGTKHHWVDIDADIFKSGLDIYSDYFDQPTNWPNYVIQTAHVCKVAKDHGIDVCFTGDGCDNLFYGYPGVFKNAKIYDSSGKMPYGLVSIAEFLFGHALLERNIGHPYRLFFRVLRNIAKEPEKRAYLMFRILDELTISNCFKLSLSKVKSDVSHFESMVLSKIPSGRSAAWYAYQGKAAISPNKSKLVGSSDYADVHLFSPYMDSKVKKLVNSLPEDQLRPTADVDDIGKYILTKMASEKKYLPDEIIYQEKVAAVDAPVDSWYKDYLSGFVKYRMKAIDGFDAKYTNALLKKTLLESAYKKYYPTADSLTTHVLSLLLTYSAFAKTKS